MTGVVLLFTKGCPCQSCPESMCCILRFGSTHAIASATLIIIRLAHHTHQQHCLFEHIVGRQFRGFSAQPIKRGRPRFLSLHELNASHYSLRLQPLEQPLRDIGCAGRTS